MSESVKRLPLGSWPLSVLSSTWAMRSIEGRLGNCIAQIGMSSLAAAVCHANVLPHPAGPWITPIALRSTRSSTARSVS